MTTHTLAFFRDTLTAGAPLELPAGIPRVIYLRSGALTLRAAGTVATLGANSAWHGAMPAHALAGKEGAEAFRWELHRGVPDSGARLAAAIDLSAAAQWLMRCDRVDFPPGGIAYTHTHQGPGIRCLLAGGLRVQSAGHDLAITPGEAWFESGPDPVLAHAAQDEPTSFARVMILPLALRGKSSIRYVLPEDQEKPKRQSYQLFVDDAIDVA
jgi:hypothetical protein